MCWSPKGWSRSGREMVARRRALETEVGQLNDQVRKYEASARAALALWSVALLPALAKACSDRKVGTRLVSFTAKGLDLASLVIQVPPLLLLNIVLLSLKLHLPLTLLLCPAVVPGDVGS